MVYNMTMKLDMSKIYDGLNQEGWLLNTVMRMMGFDEIWIDRIMDCVTLFSLFFFFLSRVTLFLFMEKVWVISHIVGGLCQGNHLSSYLLLLCAKELSTLFNHSKQNGEIKEQDAPWKPL